MHTFRAYAMTTAVLCGMTLLPYHVSATPLGSAAGSAILQSQDAAGGSALVDVQYRRRSGAAGAFIAGAIIGGVIASQAYPYYAPYPVYPYYGPYAYPVPAYDAAIAYCMRRFRSYDPYTMTYLGYDGRRHRCP
jgi:BA14K-like protein